MKTLNQIKECNHQLIETVVFKKPGNIRMDDEHYQQFGNALNKVIYKFGKDVIKNTIDDVSGLWSLITHAMNRIWMTDDNRNIKITGRYGIEHDDDWRDKTRKYKDIHFENAAKSIIKQIL